MIATRLNVLLSLGCLILLAAGATGCAGTVRTEPLPADADAAKDFTTTASGLKYRILRKSDGKKPTLANQVSAHYKGWLDGGFVFDSSYSKGGKPITFPLANVVEGWQEGLQLIGEGGMIELEIPGKLGYKEAGFPPTIPPNATLHFIVELEEVK